MTGGFLLDTNIPSELMHLSALFLSVVSIGELETGFTTMRDQARRERLEAALESHLAVLFPGRVLPVTQAIAARWGRLDGIRQLAGRPLSAPDGMIAATAVEHSLLSSHEMKRTSPVSA